jgi:hypothetical protein
MNAGKTKGFCWTPSNDQPALAIAMAHSGHFEEGQAGAAREQHER